MKRPFLSILIFTVLTVSFVFSQQKYALVIGNGAYTGISPLSNPVNDANDMEAALRDLGFTVEKVINGDRARMEAAVINLRNRLSAARNSYGLFFYAGHGVQSNGENYFIPVNADISSESLLRDRAVSLQFVLSELENAGNELNMIVLDACRNNPYSWSRSGSRGLAVAQAPAGTIVMYATSVNSVADDGSGRNGLFTTQLLNNLKTPGLSVLEIFSRTGEGVIKASNGKQHPEISIKYFGTAYLGGRSAAQPIQTSVPSAVQGSSLLPSEPGMVRVEGSGSIQSFYIGRYEVTQKEWERVMGITLKHHRDNINRSMQLRGEGDNYPMYLVSWLEAVEYCNRLSEKEKLTPVYKIDGTNVTWNREANGYRLPTEAEWMYACRADRVTDSTGWYNANSGSRANPVGQKQPNNFGIYDMLGNVSEWVWENVYYGGSWSDSTASPATKRAGARTLRLVDLGFRVARNAD